MKFVIGDFPHLISIDFAARNSKLLHLMALFKKFAIELQNRNYSFDPLVFAGDIFIKPKAKYKAEMLR